MEKNGEMAEGFSYDLICQGIIYNIGTKNTYVYTYVAIHTNHLKRRAVSSVLRVRHLKYVFKNISPDNFKASFCNTRNTHMATVNFFTKKLICVHIVFIGIHMCT